MISEGFEVVYIPIDIIQKAFDIVGIDAHWVENTQESILQDKIDDFSRLSQPEIERIKDELINLTRVQLENFCLKLCKSLERKIETIRIIPVFGNETTFSCIYEARDFISTFNEKIINKPIFYKFEIFIRYSNGDRLEAQFIEKSNAIAFLENIG